MIEIAEKDYADKDAVEKVVNLLNQIRQNASDSLDRETDAESKAVEAHALDIKNSQERIVQAGKDLRDSRDNLATTVGMFFFFLAKKWKKNNYTDAIAAAE